MTIIIPGLPSRWDVGDGTFVSRKHAEALVESCDEAGAELGFDNVTAAVVHLDHAIELLKRDARGRYGTPEKVEEIFRRAMLWHFPVQP